MTGVHVLGVGMTKFGKHPDADAAGLGAEAFQEAVGDAGIDTPPDRSADRIVEKMMLVGIKQIPDQLRWIIFGHRNP